MASSTTMRRYVNKLGGRYSRQARQWVFVTPGSIVSSPEPHYFWSLDDIYQAIEGLATVARNERDLDRREAETAPMRR